MKICPVCGSQSGDNYSNCLACGTPLQEAQSQMFDESDDSTTVLQNPDVPGMVPPQGMPGMGMPPQQGMLGMGMPPQQGMPGMGMPPQQGMPGMGMPPQQGMPGMGMPPQQGMLGMGMPSQQGMPGMGMPSQQGMPNMKPPASKGKIFAIIGALAAVLIIAIVLIVSGNKKVNNFNTSSSRKKEDVPRIVVEGMRDCDLKKIKTVCPPFMENASTSSLEEALDMIDEYDMEITYIGVTSTYDYSKDEITELEEDIQYDTGSNIKLDAACDIKFQYNMKANVFGMDYDKDVDQEIIAIKYKGEWYMYE